MIYLAVCLVEERCHSNTSAQSVERIDREREGEGEREIPPLHDRTWARVELSLRFLQQSSIVLTATLLCLRYWRITRSGFQSKFPARDRLRSSFCS